MPDKIDPAAELARLKVDRASVPWPERRSIAASLVGAFAAADDRNLLLVLVDLLADDPKWEVRQEVTRLLPQLSDSELAPLAAKLADDSNAFVRNAANRALELRRRGVTEAGARGKGLDNVVAQFDLFNHIEGTAAGNKLRRLAVRLYEFSVSATVHDLRGVLTSAQANVDRLQEEAEKPTCNRETMRDGLSKVARRLAYLEKFVDAMSSFSRPIPQCRTTIDVSVVVRDAHAVTIDALRSAGFDLSCVKATVDVSSGIQVAVAQHEVVIAIANVLKNAYESLLLFSRQQDGGAVGIAADCLADVVRIVVHDNGVGMNDADLRELRMFGPGRTTKKGYGTGFGLPIAQKYIAAHGGSIVVASEENCGTTVTITLPTTGENGGDE